jgi:hypothetical protein
MKQDKKIDPIDMLNVSPSQLHEIIRNVFMSDPVYNFIDFVKNDLDIRISKYSDEPIDGRDYVADINELEERRTEIESELMNMDPLNMLKIGTIINSFDTKIGVLKKLLHDQNERKRQNNEKKEFIKIRDALNTYLKTPDVSGDTIVW